MSETGNIEDLAKIVSNDIFKWLKWKTCPLKDIDLKCVSDHHQKKTHPADVVFYYDDPYSGEKIYLNTDLKSYKKGSIQAPSVTKALQSLAMAVECANISEDWKKKFLINNLNFGKVIGLLFIYNHDDEFDKSLSEVLQLIDFTKINIAEHVELVFFDPDRIRNLLNIITDIKGLIADDELPKKDYSFFYPDLVMSRRHGGEWGQPASIEALTAPWLMIKHRAIESIKEGYLIYYHMPGQTVEEFIYLIDAMSHYQMLLSDTPIRVRFTNPSKMAANNFAKAKVEYSGLWGNDEARDKQLEKIEAQSISKVVSSYCPMEIGMRENV